jgi:hypothetical protein
MGLRDAGEAFLARVGAPEGDAADPVDVDTSDAAAPDGRDVWVRVQDELAGAPSTARLHVPGNVLFALPEAGETVMVLRGRDTDGPGAAYVFLGDAGRALPPWLRTAVGLFTAKVLRLESTGARVVVVAQGGAGHVLLNRTADDQGQRLARVADRVVVGTLSGMAGPYPVQLMFTPLGADGVTPGAPTALSAVTALAAVVEDTPGNGAPKVRA